MKRHNPNSITKDLQGGGGGKNGHLFLVQLLATLATERIASLF